MLKKTLAGLGIGLFSLALVVPASAQEVATLALRNGERPSGQLIDLGAGGFVLRVNGQDRTIPASEVAAVEFVVGAPPAEAVTRINAGTPVVVLRSGQVIEGRLSDIGGTAPLRLTVDTPSGQRDFTSNDVAQLYVNPVPMSAATSGTAAAAGTAVPAGAISVPANQAWTDTGITIRRGDRLTITGTGDIQLGNNNSSGVGGSPAATVPGIRYPVEGLPAGALIGRVGNGRPFAIQNGQPMTIAGTGRLQIGVNDDNVADNSGNYVVTITR
jgi:hypothetical protein